MEAAAAREARLAGVARAARVRAAAEAAAVALDPEPEPKEAQAAQQKRRQNLNKRSAVAAPKPAGKRAAVTPAAVPVDINSAESNYKKGMDYYAKEDYKQAFPFLEKAATPKGEYKGYAKAQCNLGYMYQHGEGVEEDHAQAARLYQLAADQGHESAQRILEGLLEQHPELAQQQPTDPHTPPS